MWDTEDPLPDEDEFSPEYDWNQFKLTGYVWAPPECLENRVELRKILLEYFHWVEEIAFRRQYQEGEVGEKPIEIESLMLSNANASKQGWRIPDNYLSFGLTVKGWQEGQALNEHNWDSIQEIAEVSDEVRIYLTMPRITNLADGDDDPPPGVPVYH
jgi:hypothetical protein